MSGFEANRPLDSWRWLAVPAVVVVVAVVLTDIPLRILGIRLPEPIYCMVYGL